MLGEGVPQSIFAPGLLLRPQPQPRLLPHLCLFLPTSWAVVIRAGLAQEKTSSVQKRKRQQQAPEICLETLDATAVELHLALPAPGPWRGAPTPVPKETRRMVAPGSLGGQRTSDH